MFTALETETENGDSYQLVVLPIKGNQVAIELRLMTDGVFSTVCQFLMPPAGALSLASALRAYTLF